MNEIPYREYKKFAFGVLHWAPKDFEDATIEDLECAMAGWKELNGIKEKEPITPELMKEFEELKKRFPDG